MIDLAEIDDRIAKCEQLLDADPNSQIFAALAEAYRKKGDLTRAQEVCLQGLKIHPQYSAARVVLAKILMAKDSFDAAWDELKKSVAASGRTRSIDILEAEILIRKGQKTAAGVILSRLQSSDPQDENVRSLIALMNGASVARPTHGVDMALDSLRRTEKKEKREISLSNAISILKLMPRVMGAIAVSHNGIVLDARFDGIYTKEELAALSKEIFDSAKAGARMIDTGTAREVLIESPASKIWIFSRERYLLVIYTRDDVSMGALRLKIEEIFQRVEFQQNGGAQ